MYSGMNTEITLITVTPGNGSLSSTPTRTYAPVYAEKRSVARSEFYSAMNAGTRVDIVFLVNPDEYTDQTEVNEGGTLAGGVLTGGTNYSVVRSYIPARGMVELNCARR